MKCSLFLFIIGLVTSMAWGDSRPNIVFVFSDDHATQAISAYGGRLADVAPTPHLDRIAEEGMRFTRCMVTNSICGPSRATILTGKYSHLNGFYKNEATKFDGSQQTFPKLLQRAGYETAIIGKWHLASDPTGFDHWEILPGQGSYYNPDFRTAGGKHREIGSPGDDEPVCQPGVCGRDQADAWGAGCEPEAVPGSREREAGPHQHRPEIPFGGNPETGNRKKKGDGGESGREEKLIWSRRRNKDQSLVGVVPGFGNQAGYEGQTLVPAEADRSHLLDPVVFGLAIDVMPSGLPWFRIGHHDEPGSRSEGLEEVAGIGLFDVFDKFATPDEVEGLPGMVAAADEVVNDVRVGYHAVLLRLQAPVDASHLATERFEEGSAMTFTTSHIQDRADAQLVVGPLPQSWSVGGGIAVGNEETRRSGRRT